MKDFNFFVDIDVDLEKSNAEDEMIIRGYASTPDQDRQGENLVQEGLDISDFVNHGYFNFDHDNSIILGYPTKNTGIDEKGFYVEGKLLKGVPVAERMWKLAVALKKNGAPRQLGFSVEGKVLEREGNRITKAKIYNVAITPNPVNTNATWEAVVKSFTHEIEKSLEAGYGTSPETQSGGGAMRTESIDKELKVLSYNLDNFNYWEQVKNSLANGGKVTKSDMIVYLQLAKGMSRAEALSIIDT